MASGTKILEYAIETICMQSPFSFNNLMDFLRKWYAFLPENTSLEAKN